VDDLIWDAWMLAPTTREELRSFTMVSVRGIVTIGKTN